MESSLPSQVSEVQDALARSGCQKEDGGRMFIYKQDQEVGSELTGSETPEVSTTYLTTPTKPMMSPCFGVWFVDHLLGSGWTLTRLRPAQRTLRRPCLSSP